jgi:hypothetical protein
VRFYSCERQLAFFDGHMQAFSFFGGVFPTLIYDYVPRNIIVVMWPTAICGRWTASPRWA